MKLKCLILQSQHDKNVLLFNISTRFIHGLVKIKSIINTLTRNFTEDSQVFNFTMLMKQ